jgi:Fic family protein
VIVFIPSICAGVSHALSLTLPEKNRDETYRLLQEIRISDNWEEWHTFFLTAVLEISRAAIQTALDCLRLFGRDAVALQLQAASVIRVAEAARALGVSTPAAIKALATLEKCGVVHEINGQHCRRHDAYRSDLEILDADAL